MAKVKNIQTAELDRRPTKLEVNFDAPSIRLFVETGVTVLGQRHTSSECITLNGQQAIKLIGLLNIDTLALDTWIIQDLPLTEDSELEETEDYVLAAEKMGHRVAEAKVEKKHGKQE